MSAITLNLTAFLAVATLGFALILVGVSALSYRRLRSTRLLFVTGAFAVLALEGALSTYGAVVQHRSDLVGAGLDFLILALLYASIARR